MNVLSARTGTGQGQDQAVMQTALATCIQALDGELAQLEERIKTLSDRLQPIRSTRPTAPSMANEKSNYSPLVEALYAMKSRIARLKMDVVTVLEEVEI